MSRFPLVNRSPKHSSSGAVFSPGSTGKGKTEKTDQPSQKSTVLFSKTGAPPPDMTAWARQYLNGRAQAGQGNGDSPNAAAVLQLVDAVAQLPTKSFDINQALKTGELTPVVPQPGPGQATSGKTPASAPFKPATTFELEMHHLALKNRDHTGPFSDTQAVDEFTTQMGRQKNAYVAPKTAGAVSDLLEFIETGNPNKTSLGVGGMKQRPINTLGNRRFDGPLGPLKALHHLCFETSFLRDLKPAQAAIYMGQYERLAKAAAEVTRQQAI